MAFHYSDVFRWVIPTQISDDSFHICNLEVNNCLLAFGSEIKTTRRLSFRQVGSRTCSYQNSYCVSLNKSQLGCEESDKVPKHTVEKRFF